MAVLPLVAGASESQLQQVDVEAIHQLFGQLSEAFTQGNHRLVRSLTIARDEAEARRVEDLVWSVRREFKRNAYTAFIVRDWAVSEKLGNARLDVWVKLQTVCTDSEDNAVQEDFHNDVFLLERQSNGAFLIVDSPYFLTLGRQQGVDLMADALLASIGCLVGLVFWVWMGFATFRLRPRRPGWRVLVLLLPLLGASIFFLFCYLPGLFRRPNARPEAGS